MIKKIPLGGCSRKLVVYRTQIHLPKGTEDTKGKNVIPCYKTLKNAIECYIKTKDQKESLFLLFVFVGVVGGFFAVLGRTGAGKFFESGIKSGFGIKTDIQSDF